MKPMLKLELLLATLIALSANAMAQDLSCQSSRFTMDLGLTEMASVYDNPRASGKSGEDLRLNNFYFVDNGPFIDSDQGRVKAGTYKFSLQAWGSDFNCEIFLPNRLVGSFTTSMYCSDDFDKEEVVGCKTQPR